MKTPFVKSGRFKHCVYEFTRFLRHTVVLNGTSSVILAVHVFICRMKGNTYLEISSTLERRSRELEENKLIAFVISALDASEWWFSLRFVCFALGNDWYVPTDFEAANQSKRGAENKSFYHYLEQNPIRSIRVAYSNFTHASILLPFKYSIVSLLTCVPLLAWGNSTEFRKRPLLL